MIDNQLVTELINLFSFYYHNMESWSKTRKQKDEYFNIAYNVKTNKWKLEHFGYFSEFHFEFKDVNVCLIHAIREVKSWNLEILKKRGC